MAVGRVLKIPGNAGERGGRGNVHAGAVAGPADCVSPHGRWGLMVFCAGSQRFGRDLIENVTAEITLIDADGQSVASKSTVLPLDILPPDQCLPLAVFFPPGVPDGCDSAGADSDRDADCFRMIRVICRHPSGKRWRGSRGRA